MKTFEKPIEPDIEELLAVIRREAASSRVHHIELFLDEEIKDQVCDRFGLTENIDENEA